MILDDLKEPIVQAPMAGGPSTPALTAAVGSAGGLGFLAAGYKTADALREEIADLRRLSNVSFGVNLFVPDPEPAKPDRLAPYLDELRPEAARYGVELGSPRHDDDDWDAKLDLVGREQVAVVSFTFGCPASTVVRRLQASGAEVWVTITTPAEGRDAVRAGADVLVVQGAEAGGHRATFADAPELDGLGLLALMSLVRRAFDVPLVASGGIMTGAGVAAVLCAGASAAQIGTALMRTPEAATSPAHRWALARPGHTGLTRAFSGRLARGIINRFQHEHTATAPQGYPEIHHVTSPVRAEARRRGDADGFNLWAGQGFELGTEGPAAAVVARLGSQAREILQQVASRQGRRG